MKRILLAFVLFNISSCTDDRDNAVPNQKYENAGFDLQKQAQCSQGFVKPELFGNPADYPKIENSTFYSMAPPENHQWFFREIDDSVTNYINNKYYPTAEVVIPWSTAMYFPANWGAYQNDFMYYTETIYRSDPQFTNGLIPDTIITAEEGSYILYRILSDIDSRIEHIYNYSSLHIRPVAISYFYSNTMCGDYLGLYAKVYYKKY